MTKGKPGSRDYRKPSSIEVNIYTWKEWNYVAIRVIDTRFYTSIMVMNRNSSSGPHTLQWKSIDRILLNSSSSFLAVLFFTCKAPSNTFLLPILARFDQSCCIEITQQKSVFEEDRNRRDLRLDLRLMFQLRETCQIAEQIFPSRRDSPVSYTSSYCRALSLSFLKLMIGSIRSNRAQPSASRTEQDQVRSPSTNQPFEQAISW